MRAPCLDAVCKLLQSFGSDRLHGGDEGGQLVLGARRRALQTAQHIITVIHFCHTRTFWEFFGVQLGPAAWYQTQTCSSSGV